MRAALLALGAVVVAWAAGHAYEWRLWEAACETPLPDPADDVQPPDPRTTRPVVVTLPSSLTPAEVGHIRTWLHAHPDVVTELYESEPIRSTQSGPIGPSA